jgi:acyl-CoA-binding protein
MADAADATFDGAADRVASAALAGTLPAGAALTLYALFKQATAGDCATKRPPLWDVKGRAKW